MIGNMVLLRRLAAAAQGRGRGDVAVLMSDQNGVDFILVTQ